MNKIEFIKNELERDGYKLSSFLKINGGINSNTFKIECDENKYLLKIIIPNRLATRKPIRATGDEPS